MRNRYPGNCLRCGESVAAGEGYFQCIIGKGWAVRCRACVGKGNKPAREKPPEPHVSRAALFVIAALAYAATGFLHIPLPF